MSSLTATSTTVGHGTIRLRGRDAPASAAVVANAAATSVPAPGGIGHGTIRMRGYAVTAVATPVAAPPPAREPAGPAGHGTIRLRGR